MLEHSIPDYKAVMRGVWSARTGLGEIHVKCDMLFLLHPDTGLAADGIYFPCLLCKFTEITLMMEAVFFS